MPPRVACPTWGRPGDEVAVQLARCLGGEAGDGAAQAGDRKPRRRASCSRMVSGLHRAARSRSSVHCASALHRRCTAVWAGSSELSSSLATRWASSCDERISDLRLPSSQRTTREAIAIAVDADDSRRQLGTHQ